MQLQEKRQHSDTDLSGTQSGNRQWWTTHTMSYDWTDKIDKEQFTDTWFNEIDRRFVHGARLFAHDRQPFDRLIPFEQLKGRDVLEIGCGMGFHSELMLRAGANLTAIDISDTSVEATHRRLALRQLTARVERMDATTLEFSDGSFDFRMDMGRDPSFGTDGQNCEGDRARAASGGRDPDHGLQHQRNERVCDPCSRLSSRVLAGPISR
jgi:2-polyprenyl-3-methyl-5-hydroxy-6-metoxy-1,4-benzoquinol methylase